MTSGPSRGGYANRPAEAPNPNTPTSATAVSHDCVGFYYSWPCGHTQNSLHDSNGCLLQDDPGLLNHVHFLYNIGSDGFPCPICPQTELPPPAYQPPIAEASDRTQIDDLQWRVDAMARDPHFQALQAEVAARTPAPPAVDPWRREDPKDLNDWWQDIMRLGMRLVEMRREPRGPGSGPPPSPDSQLLSPGLQATRPGPHATSPSRLPTGTAASEAQQSPAQETPRIRSNLNPVTAFRGPFILGNLVWTHNRLSRRRAARARHEWLLAHSQSVWTTRQPPTAPGQPQPAPPQFRGQVTHTPAHQTGMQQAVTAADLEDMEHQLGALSAETSGVSGWMSRPS